MQYARRERYPGTYQSLGADRLKVSGRATDPWSDHGTLTPKPIPMSVILTTFSMVGAKYS